MSVQQDQEDQQGRVGPFVTYVERVRPDGAVARWDSRRHRKHPQGAPAAGDLVGAPGPGLVDRRPVRRRVAAVRPRRGPRLRQRGRGQLGRGDLLHRLAVLHLSRVLDLPGGRGRRPADPGDGPAPVLRLPARPDRLAGHRGAAGRDRVLQRQHRGRDGLRPVRAGRAPARVAARRLRLGLPSWSPARWPGSRPATAGPPGAPGPGPGGSPCSTWPGPSPSACPPWPATSARPPARSTTPS
jgi:hypothetical protein